MYRSAGIFLATLLLTACVRDSPSIDNLPQDKLIKAYFNHRATASTYVEPYRQIERGGDNLEAVILEAIAIAESSIDLAVQEFNLPLVAQALANKKLAGVAVRVILDSNYSRSFADFSAAEIDRLDSRDRQKYQQYLQLVDLDRNGRLSPNEIAQRDAIEIMHGAGIKIIDDTADGSKGSGLMHHKFMIIDRQIVVTGSTNFTLSGVYGDLNNLTTRGNVNHLLRIERPEVASLFGSEFDYMWGNPQLGIKSKFGLAKPWRSPKSLSWQDTEMIIQFAPTSNRQDWSFSTNGLINQTIEHARESIDLALFVFSEQQLANSLQRKSRQGIKVRGVFDRGFAYRYYSEVLDLLGRVMLRRCQPELDNSAWVNPLNTVGTALTDSGDKLHHKFAAIDNKTVISGSQNWSMAANNRNDEAILIINNSAVASHFSREFLRLFSSANLGISASAEQKLEQEYAQCQ